jgi:two-component sensor histidine kinase
MLPEAQIGFADANLDDDGFLRRSLLADDDAQGNYRFSLTTRLIEQYLAPEGITLENGIRDLETMRFSTAEIPRFQPSTGGYVRTNNGGNQTLINFRAGKTPFEKISYQTLMAEQVDPALLQDRVVLVGYTAESVKDFVSSLAVTSDSPSLIPGVEVQAHAVSQVLSALYDGRPFIKALPDGLEYLLILAAGLLGMALAQRRTNPALHLLVIIMLGAGWLLICYSLLVASWWLPVIPVAAAFLLNAVALYPFYQFQFQLRSQLNERQQLIDWTYNTIHNGPLQIAANMLKTWPENQVAPVATRQELQMLNQELRDIYEAMRQEMLMPSGQLVMAGRRTVDLDVPLHELLYETYKATLERRSAFFTPILQITDFKPMVDNNLTIEQKRDLARFLEEALINVFKYAKGTTRLMVTCSQADKNNIIQVIDNHVQDLQNKDLQSKELQNKDLKRNPQKLKGGYGTQQAQRLASQLGGQFERAAITPSGIRCELRWPVQFPAWKRWLR